MKQLIIGIVFLIFGTAAQAQWTKNAVVNRTDLGDVIEFETVVEGTDTVTLSTPFNLNTHYIITDSGRRVYPVSFGFKATSDSAVTLNAELLGSYDNVNYFTVDTLFTGYNSTTVEEGTADLNGIIRPFYKLRLYGSGSNDSTHVAGGIYVQE